MGSVGLFADILLVSDDPAFIQRARQVLQAAGYIVRIEKSPAEALAAVQVQRPDLILRDALLLSNDDYSLIRQVKAAAAQPFVPILVISSADDPGMAAAALDAGADELMGRTASNAELLTRVRALLRFKATTDQLAELNETLERKVVERTRQLEEAHAHLRHAEKLSSLGRLAASVAHEINNPLTGIIGLLALVQEDLPADSQVQEDLALIRRQADAIGQLVSQLRDFSKPPQLERWPVVLNAMVQDVLSLAGKDLRNRNIQVQQELDPGLPAVLASPTQMGEILLNLVLNARDAMPDGGILTVRTWADDRRVHVEVVDSGAGIAPELQERIFEPFFTTKGEGGTGLGLAICHRIVHDHDGEITVRSQPGQGAAFTIQLPCCEAQ